LSMRDILRWFDDVFVFIIFFIVIMIIVCAMLAAIFSFTMIDLEVIA